MPNLLDFLKQRKAVIDTGAGENATAQNLNATAMPVNAAPQQTITENVEAPWTGVDFFKQKPKPGAIIRRTDDAKQEAIKWNDGKQIWEPVHTFFHEKSGIWYWYNPEDQQYYPFERGTPIQREAGQ